VPIPNSFTLYVGQITPPSPLSIPSLPHLKQLHEVSSSYFVYVYGTHQPYSLTLISSIHPPTSTSPCTESIFQSCLSLLIPNSVFKGVSRCVPAVSVLSFGPFNPFHYSPLNPYLPFPIIQQLSVYLILSCTCRCNVDYHSLFLLLLSSSIK
jgi:hypothetical protein